MERAEDFWCPIPYATACAMYHPEPGAIWYQPETMKNSKIVALMNKVKADGFVKMTGMLAAGQDVVSREFEYVKESDLHTLKSSLFLCNYWGPAQNNLKKTETKLLRKK